METISVVDIVDNRGWLFSAICIAIKDKYKEVLPDEKTTTIEIDLKLNGVQIPLSGFIEALGAEYEQKVKEHAKALIQDQLGGLSNAISKLEEEANLACDSLRF